MQEEASCVQMPTCWRRWRRTVRRGLDRQDCAAARNLNVWHVVKRGVVYLRLDARRERIVRNDLGFCAPTMLGCKSKLTSSGYRSRVKGSDGRVKARSGMAGEFYGVETSRWTTASASSWTVNPQPLAATMVAPGSTIAAPTTPAASKALG